MVWLIVTGHQLGAADTSTFHIRTERNKLTAKTFPTRWRYGKSGNDRFYEEYVPKAGLI